MIHQSFFLALLLFLQRNHLSTLAEFSCNQNNGNYTTADAYAANLNATLSALSTNIDADGFYNASAGEGSDRVNAAALCRGDIQVDACRDCVRSAAAGLLQLCPEQKEAVIWYSSFCMVRYSNATIHGIMWNYPVYHYDRTENSTSPEQFNRDLQGLMDDLRKKAAAGSSLRKVAAGNTTGPDFETIFALVQCTPDLSSGDCARCLIDAILEIQKCCAGKVGGLVLMPSCNIRFEISPFFNETRLKEMEQLSSPPQSPPPPVSGPPPQLSPEKDDDDKTTRTIIIIIIVIAISVCLVMVLSIIIFLWKRKKHNSIESDEASRYFDEAVDEISSAESVQYAFSTIKAATDDFSLDNKLGQGGFGAVYKGKLPNGKEIVVKRLSRDSGQGDLEFKNEVVLLAKLQHRNLVKLLGFALEGKEKLLVYEFVQNSSLDHFIFDPNIHSKLDWDLRYKIIIGIARGILYLHEDSRLKIIHRDLKTSNILLDKDVNPKISDFGMARLFSQDETQGSTSRVVGTYGYMPPEYLLHGQFSIKSDVFSFGVLLLELISGRRNNVFPNKEGVEYLLNFAWRSWEEGRAVDVVDPFLRPGSGSINEMMRCIHIGLLCVQEDARDRPTMASVLLMLSSFSITLALPSRPAFYSGTGFTVDSSTSTSSLPTAELARPIVR